MIGDWPRVEMLTYRIREGAVRQVIDLADVRANTVTPGALPDRGTVAVVGRVAPFEDRLVRPAGSLTPSVVCRVRVDAYRDPIADPGRRSFTDGLVATDDVHAVPFVLSAGRPGDGGGRAVGPARAVVDPVPRAADEGLVPEESVRPRAAYVTSDLHVFHEELVVADRLRNLDERRRSWLRESTDLAGDVRPGTRAAGRAGQPGAGAGPPGAARAGRRAGPHQRRLVAVTVPGRAGAVGVAGALPGDQTPVPAADGGYESTITGAGDV